MKLNYTADLTPYIKLLTRDQKKVLKANPDQGHRVVNASLNRNASFRCVACNKLMVSPFTLGKTCSPICLENSKKSTLGKKRPEHAARMKKLMLERIAAGTWWNAEHRANNKRHLDNVNSTIDREASAEVRNSPPAIRKRLKKLVNRRQSFTNHPFFLGSSLAQLTISQIDSASDKQILAWNKDVNSIKSTVAMDRNPNMGATQFYKRMKITGIKFNERLKSVVTRSSLEYNFVKWLEKNEIKWRYEWVRLDCGDGKHYIPDFKIQIGDEIWVVETKGVYFSRGSSGFSFKKEKTGAAWCRSKGYKYTVLCADQIGKLGKSVDHRAWVDLSAISDKKLTKYLVKTIPGGKNVNN